MEDANCSIYDELLRSFIVEPVAVDAVRFVTPENSLRSICDSSDYTFEWEIDSNHDGHSDFNEFYPYNELVIFLGSKVVAKDPPGITTIYRQFKREVIRKRQKIPQDKLYSWVYPQLLHYLQGRCTTITTIDDIQFYQKNPNDPSSYRRLTGSERDAAIIRDIQTNNTGRNHKANDKASSFSIVEQFIANAKAQLKYAQSDITGELYQLFYGMLNIMELIASAVIAPKSNESLIKLFQKIFKMNFKWFIKPTCGPQKRKPTANAIVAKTPPVRTIECDHRPHARSSAAEESSRPDTSSLSFPSEVDPQDWEPIVVVEERPTLMDDHKLTCSGRHREANDALAAHPSSRDWNAFDVTTIHHPIKVEGGVGVADERESTSRKKRKENESVATQQGTSENGTTGRNTAQRPDVGRDDDSISLTGVEEMSIAASVAYSDHVEFETDVVDTLDDNFLSEIIEYGYQYLHDF